MNSENRQCQPSAAVQAVGDLRDSERSFRLLVESVIDYAIYMLDPSGNITNWNAGAERIKGYKASEVIGKHFGMFYTPEDRAAGFPVLTLETARREGRFAAEGWRIRKDGARFRASVVVDPIYDDGVLIGFAKITRDVTERDTAHNALLDSERHFRLLIRGVTDYALYMLDPQGYVSSWNIGGQRIKGYEPEEIVGRHFSKFYTPNDRDAGKPARALAIARETGRYEEEGWRVRKDGTFFWASVVIDAVHDDDGTLIGFAKITRDISERREAQVALERVQRQLAEAQKMDALGQLTGGVAHDFNNLLMVVTGHIPTLKKIAENDPRALRAAQAIELAAERGARLTRQLLTFSRRQRVDPLAIDLAERIESVRDVLTSGLGANVTLNIGIPPGTWPVLVDTTELEIALVNMVVNARDAMPNGGTVTIDAQNRSHPGDEGLPAGDYVVVTVADTGVGIPDDVLTRVFEPFFTTKPEGKGTGLGLSQVYGFAHQAGGAISIDSTLGKGTSVNLYLPRTTTVPQTAREESVSLVPAAKSTGTVLLVEDNPEVASASAGLFEQLGYTVRWVPSAEAALAALEKNGIDMVCSDIVMPGDLDGLGLANMIRQRWPTLPVLLATGYSEAARRAEHDFHILRKPYGIEDLGGALARLNRA